MQPKINHQKFFLIDAHALCYRCFYAIRDLSTSKGQQTNAIYGFVNVLRKIIRSHQPDYLAICFDSKAMTERQKIYAEYKIQRPKMPEDLISQIPIIKEIMKAYNIVMVEQEGMEADDLIATFAKKFCQNDIDVYIVSDDRDMFQLVNDQVHIYSVKKELIFGKKEVAEKLGFSPVLVPDFIGLAGDKSDNIPGVKGIGEVTARKLIQEYGDIDGIYQHIGKLTSATVKSKLEHEKDMAYLSKQLAVLHDNLDLKFNLEDVKISDPNRSKLFELFTDLEFKKFAEEFAPLQHEKIDCKLKEITKEQEIDDVLQAARSNKKIYFLYEKNEDSLFNQDDSLLLYAGGKIAFRMKESLFDQLAPLWDDNKVLKVSHDIKFFYRQIMPHLKTRVERGAFFDIMLAAYLLSPNDSSYKINDLAWKYLNQHIPPETDMCQMTVYLERLEKILIKELEDKALLTLFEDIEMPLAWVLACMESRGVGLDRDYLNNLSVNVAKDIEALVKVLYQEAGEEFNLNSPKQLSHILFEKLELPVIKKTKTGFSTNEAVLTTLAKNHDFPAKIIEYRHLSKIKSTYIDALPKMVDGHTGRVHTFFNQVGTETGRLSSSQPNLQNIPIRTAFGRQIRRAFVVSDPKNILLAADYSQIELRILAHLSKDPGLMMAFNQNQDIHNYVASLIFEVEEKDVTKEMRYSAKRVNFGIVYGMSAFGLANDLKISQAEAQTFIDKYFLRYPRVQRFMQEQIEMCQKKGFVQTICNRRRYIPEINSKNNTLKQFAQRQAINTPVQGSAADLMKLSMVSIHKEMQKRKFRSSLLITVHDELVFEMIPIEQGDLIQLVKNLMEQALPLSVPIKVTIKTGKNWAEMQDTLTD